jgi:hypothetical protein
MELIIGKQYILDAEFSNASIVTLIALTPLKKYATVKCEDGNVWQTMAYRLIELSEPQTKDNQ